MDYLDYVAAAPRPSVVVIQDKDEPAGYGAFWGEVQTNVHKALGCLGTVTNGSVRDIASVAEGSNACRLDRAITRLWCISLSSAFRSMCIAWKCRAAI